MSESFTGIGEQAPPRFYRVIKDFDEFQDEASVTADICIVGAGAAGITIAREFRNTRHTIVILESQKLYETEIVGLPHTNFEEGRVRIFGGTTTLWGGQALRFDTLDFQKRSWVPYSGWPISRQELDPYYERAERVLQTGACLSYDNLCASSRVESPGFDPDQVGVECSQWSPRPNFGQEYRDELRRASNVSVVLHANVTGIITNQAATVVEHIEFQTLAGKKGIAKADFYIICCGGIETARLLLTSDRIESHGVGNRNDLVGRYYQEHPLIWFGELQTTNRERLQNLFESFYRGSLKYFPILILSEQLQAEKQLLNIQGSFSFENVPGAPITAMKSLYRAVISKTYPGFSELRRLLTSALSEPRELFGLAYRFYVQKRAGTPKRGRITFGAQSEMAPNPCSRIMLSENRDQLGMRRIKLDWQMGELERRTASEFVRTLACEFERLGLGTYDLRQAAALDGAEWVNLAHDSAHHMGTTRMHETPQLGVVDPNCKVHGIANLFIGSSAVFPTSSRANPTLTILALCIRIADRLKQIA
jgi:choline dehydrogenase-like flavoprotein